MERLYIQLVAHNILDIAYHTSLNRNRFCDVGGGGGGSVDEHNKHCNDNDDNDTGFVVAGVFFFP